jgi:hypothetical protein
MYLFYYRYVPKKKRDKLDKKVEAGIYIGYSTTKKVYRYRDFPQTN